MVLESKWTSHHWKVDGVTLCRGGRLLLSSEVEINKYLLTSVTLQ